MYRFQIFSTSATRTSVRTRRAAMGALSPKHASTIFRLKFLSPNSIIVARVVIELVLRTIGVGPAGFVGRFGVVGPLPLGLEPNGCEPPGVCVGCDGDRVSVFLFSCGCFGRGGPVGRGKVWGAINYSDGGGGGGGGGKRLCAIREPVIVKNQYFSYVTGSFGVRCNRSNNETAGGRTRKRMTRARRQGCSSFTSCLTFTLLGLSFEYNHL